MQDKPSETNPQNIENDAKPITVKTVGSAAIKQGKKAAEMVDKASSVADNAGNVLGTIKWVAIAVVMVVIAGGAYGTYKVVSAPVKAAANATEAVTDSVKSGAERLKDGGASVVNRLDIPVSNLARLDRASEHAFTALSTMAVSEPENVKDRMLRAKNFNGNDGRVCKLDIDFGNGVLPVTLAADNEAYASAKALGSNNNRMMRMIIEAGKNDLALSVIWDEAVKNWALKWKATTLKKTVSDEVAARRALEVLNAAKQACK